MTAVAATTHRPRRRGGRGSRAPVGRRVKRSGALDPRHFRVFTARCYASAVLAMGLCLSVCLSVRVRVRLSQVGVLSKRMNESGWFLARELHSTYPTLCYKEIHVPSKIRVPPSGILLQTLDLENFATSYRSSKRVINLARER